MQTLEVVQKMCSFSRPARETCHQEHEMEEVPTSVKLFLKNVGNQGHGKEVFLLIRNCHVWVETFVIFKISSFGVGGASICFESGSHQTNF